MPVIDRYLFKQLLTAFLIVLAVLTLIVWLTTSLRQLELITAQGQTFGIFLILTLLAIPLLISQISPFAMFIGSVFVLNKLGSDSELIVLSASGLSEKRLLKPFIALAVLVCLVAWLFTLWIVPVTLRELRVYITNVRADLIGSVIQPGKFSPIEKGVTLHVRDRAANGALLGVFISDQRDEELEMAYLSSKGLIIRTKDGTFLILENGQIIRKPKGKAFGSIIAFDRYAFNLSSMMGTVAPAEFTPSERPTSELLSPQKRRNIPSYFIGRARSELHDRFTMPLYNLAFLLIAFAALGKAYTTRHNRNRTIIFAIFSVVFLRILGFGMSALTQITPATVPLIYLVPIGGIVAAILLGPMGKRFSWPFFRPFSMPQQRPAER